LYDINTKTETETPFDPFNVLDCKVLYNAKKWTGFVNFSNVFDKKYYDYGNVRQAGSWISVGFSYKFLLK
jgi:iron complex outermembrane receptor protein